MDVDSGFYDLILAQNEKLEQILCLLELHMAKGFHPGVIHDEELLEILNGFYIIYCGRDKYEEEQNKQLKRIADALDVLKEKSFNLDENNQS